MQDKYIQKIITEIVQNMSHTINNMSEQLKEVKSYRYVYFIPVDDIAKWNTINHKLDFINNELQKCYTITKFEPVTNFKINAIIIDFFEKSA